MLDPRHIPKVFISHSSKNDATARRLLELLYAELAARGFAPLADRDFEPGESWRAILDRWVYECDAAVVILSKSAVESHYVFYEVIHLQHRRKVNGDGFHLIPILLPGVAPESLRGRELDAAQLYEVQAVTVAPFGEGDDAARDASLAAAAAEVLRRLAALPGRAVRHELEEDLVDRLSSLFTDQSREQLWRLLLPDLPPGLAAEDQAFALARALLDMDAPRGRARLEKLRPFARKMLNVIRARDEAKRIINIVMPFCWVDPSAASQLPRVAFGEGPTRAVAMRRSWKLSALMYLRRGCCRSQVRWVEVSSSLSGGLLDDLRSIRRCLSEQVCYEGPDASVGKINRRLDEMLKRGDAVFLLVRARDADRKLVCMLHRLWPQLTVILYGEGLTREELAEWGLGHAVYLEPPLDPEEEDQARYAWGDMMARAGLSQQQINAGEDFQI